MTKMHFVDAIYFDCRGTSKLKCENFRCVEATFEGRDYLIERPRYNFAIFIVFYRNKRRCTFWFAWNVGVKCILTDSFLSMGFVILNFLDKENIFPSMLNDFKILQYCKFTKIHYKSTATLLISNLFAGILLM